MSFSPNINVWTLGKGPRGQWKLHHTTDSLEDAIEWFVRLDDQGKQVALYELGAFLHQGKRTAGQVAFWWNEAFNGHMESEPEGRGVGWSDDFDIWVEYEHPEDASSSLTALEADRPRSEKSAPSASNHERSAYKRTGPASLATRNQGESTLRRYFLAPGRALMWFDYMFPQRGQVVATARQRGNPIVEVIQACVAWFCIIFFALIAGAILRL